MTRRKEIQKNVRRGGWMLLMAVVILIAISYTLMRTYQPGLFE